MKYLSIVFCALLICSCSTLDKKFNSSSPSNLLVEGNQQPLNVHSGKPRFSWHANAREQSHYQIQVASLVSALENNAPDLWDSEKKQSRQSLNIEYQGKPLTANQTAHWRVRIWQKGKASPDAWSDVQSWEMGLLNRSDWKAKWIQVASRTLAPTTKDLKQWITMAGSIEKEDGAPTQVAIAQLEKKPTASLFAYEFQTNKTVTRAKLHSTAGGYYEIYLNGQKVNNRIMDPSQTDFDKRILYNSDLVTDFIRPGNNVIAVELGSGWYDESIAFSTPTLNLSYGQPKFIAQLELQFSDGSTELVVSDERWLTHPSPILKDGIFSGEFFDSRKNITGWNNLEGSLQRKLWKPAQALSQWPTEKLEPQLLPPIRTVKSLSPVRILNPAKGVWVYDFGQNFTGIPTLYPKKLGLKDGQAVFLRYAEWSFPNGKISQLSGGGVATHLNQVDTFIASEKLQESWTPKFTWHGFRYVEITGLETAPSLDSISAQLTRSDVDRIGHFTSSDAHLNRIHATALWTYESNLMSVPMDCPIREKGGWTGDAHAALITANYNFNMETFWRKYLGDFQTATFTAPAIVPGKRTHGGVVDWAVAEIFIAWEHYRHSGDLQALRDQYQSLLEYMNFGETQLTNYLTSNGYGDWCDPVRKPGMPRVGGRGTSQYTSTTVTSSALFAQAANHMTKIAGLLELPTDVQRFRSLHNNISQHFHEKLYNPATGHYGSQTADALALRFEITPVHLRQGVADALNRDVTETWGGHYSVGTLGQTWLYRALSDYGYTDTAFNIFKAKGYPGYDYLFDVLDGTTLWERKGSFDPTVGKAPDRSLSHPFHSGYDGWFYEGLGGIRPLDNTVGYQDFALSPVFPLNLDSVDVAYKTGYGEIKSQWQRRNGFIKWQFTIPNNTTALVTLPNKNPKLYWPGSYEMSLPEDR